MLKITALQHHIHYEIKGSLCAFFVNYEGKYMLLKVSVEGKKTRVNMQEINIFQFFPIVCIHTDV